MSTLAMQQLVATGGYYPSYDGGFPVFNVGMIQTFAGTRPAFSAPPARGQLMPVEAYMPLYSIYRTLHGGDGMQSFALPNLDKRSVIGGRQTGMASPDALTMTYMIATENGDEAPFVGAVGMFGGSRAPGGWLACDGTVLPINTYRTLFSAIGNTYGGDGTTGFALPNLNGAAVVGTGTSVKLGQKVAGNVPGLGLDYAICAKNGIYPQPTGGCFPDDKPFLGQVLASAATTLPKGWVACNGAMLNKAPYEALFSIIGYAYGGSGSAFALPDLSGRMIVGGTPGAAGSAEMEMPMPAA